jgi:hypothetical protein
MMNEGEQPSAVQDGVVRLANLKRTHEHEKPAIQLLMDISCMTVVLTHLLRIINGEDITLEMISTRPIVHYSNCCSYANAQLQQCTHQCNKLKLLPKQVQITQGKVRQTNMICKLCVLLLNFMSTVLNHKSIMRPRNDFTPSAPTACTRPSVWRTKPSLTLTNAWRG